MTKQNKNPQQLFEQLLKAIKIAQIDYSTNSSKSVNKYSNAREEM